VRKQIGIAQIHGRPLEERGFALNHRRGEAMRTSGLITAISAATFLLTGSGPAIANEAGRDEYMTACAVCHGLQGTGDGPLAEYLTIGVPDLTVLSQSNDSEFPMFHVIKVIDGRQGLRGHGDARPDAAGNMPVWGERYEIEIAGEAGRYSFEMEIRGRILALAEYLASIQK
jgi:hypothetical protein